MAAPALRPALRCCQGGASVRDTHTHTHTLQAKTAACSYGFALVSALVVVGALAIEEETLGMTEAESKASRRNEVGVARCRLRRGWAMSGSWVGNGLAMRGQRVGNEWAMGGQWPGRERATCGQ